MYSVEINKLKAFYGEYAQADLSELNDIYTPDVVFKDALHEISSLDVLNQYFSDGRKGLYECRFEFKSQMSDAERVTLEWQMHFAHKRLKSGLLLSVDGCSILAFCPETRLVKTHTDYYDLGAMLYENIPVLGSLVKTVKRKASGVVSA